ncbi:MAG: hypothetical protein AB1791_01355 [Chloroflexota bacterium]
MTNVSPSIPLQPAVRSGRASFDWVIAILSLWMIGGIHLDAWAHHQFEVETFFTPWHGVLYSGFLAVAAVLVGTFVRQWWQRRDWRQALPAGYQLSLLGVVIFLAGGVGDGVWHTLFGIEVNIEALLSPTHLLLALGGAFIVTGPVRAAWQRQETDQGFLALLPMLISLALLLAVLSFFTAYANPFAETVVAQGTRPAVEEQVFLLQGLGVASILVQTTLMMGLLLLTVRRWTLPFGSLTFMLSLAALLSVSVHEDYQLLPVAILGGLAADVLRWRLQPSATRPGAFRLFALAVPAIFYALYFVTLALTGGVWWTVHLWAGAIVLAGLAGWLLSYGIVPPAQAAG